MKCRKNRLTKHTLGVGEKTGFVFQKTKSHPYEGIC